MIIKFKDFTFQVGSTRFKEAMSFLENHLKFSLKFLS